MTRLIPPLEASCSMISQHSPPSSSFLVPRASVFFLFMDEPSPALLYFFWVSFLGLEAYVFALADENR